MVRWLQSLERPVGIAAFNDDRALEVLEAAIDLDNIPKRRLDEGLDRLLHDIENFQEPERWDGMS